MNKHSILTIFTILTFFSICTSFKPTNVKSEIYGGWSYNFVLINNSKYCDNLSEAQMEFFKFNFSRDNKYQTNGNCLTTIGSGDYSVSDSKIFIKSTISVAEIKEMFVCYDKVNCFTKNLFPIKLLDKEREYKILNDTILHLNLGGDTTMVMTKVY